jgi:hypothetical protein
VRSPSASLFFVLFSAASLLVVAGLWLADRQHAQTPPAEMAPPPDAVATVAPVSPPIVVRDDAELERLRAEVRKLREELDAARGSLEQNERTLARTTRELERLRRPLDVDMASATLRASLAPGEGVVTGGYRLPDGTRLFAFVETDARADGGIGVASRFFSVPEELVQALGLQTLSTEAANTLQHGEVWVRDELDLVAGALAQTPSARLLTTGDTSIQPGSPGEVTFPSRPGDPPLSLNVNAVFDAQNNLDLELRIESAPGEITDADNAENAAAPGTPASEP